MAANTLYLAVHAVLLALLCTRLDAQQGPPPAGLPMCTGGNVINDAGDACVTLGASLISQGMNTNDNVALTIYAYSLVGSSVPTASISSVTVTDQLLVPSYSSMSQYMVYARRSTSGQDSRPIGFAATNVEATATMDFWTNAAFYMKLAAGSGAMKSIVSVKVNAVVTLSLRYRPYNENCYTASPAPATCTWTSLDSTNNDLSYGKYEFYVESSVAGTTFPLAYPRVVEIGSPASFYSNPTCTTESGSTTCTCGGAGYAVFNNSICVPIGRVLRQKGFKTDRDITLTHYQSKIDPFSIVMQAPPRRISQMTIRVTDDLILDNLTAASYNSLIDYDNQNVYCTISQIESQVRNAIVNQNTVAIQSATANAAGLYTVTRTLLWSQATFQYRAYSDACQGADPTGDCEWLSFPSQSHSLAAGTYEFLASAVGLFGYPPVMYTVGASSGAPATAVLPSILSLVCLLVLAIGLRLD